MKRTFNLDKTIQAPNKNYFLLGCGFYTVSFLTVLALRWVNPPSSAVIFLWELESGRSAEYSWQPINDIAPALQIAVIASEDQKFLNHFGFDFESLQKALRESNGRSYIRKGLEAWFTLWVECLWSKQRIIEVYLNIAEFGEGYYGAEAAAQDFFGVPAKNINHWQAGLLAAVLPGPKKMSAKNPSKYVQTRAIAVNEQVVSLGGVGYIKQLSEK